MLDKPLSSFSTIPNRVIPTIRGRRFSNGFISRFVYIPNSMDDLVGYSRNVLLDMEVPK